MLSSIRQGISACSSTTDEINLQIEPRQSQASTSTSRLLRNLLWCEPGKTKQKLKKMAVPILVETSLLLGYSAAAAQFIEADTPWYNNPFFSTALILLLNTVIRIPNYDYLISEAADAFKDYDDELLSKAEKEAPLSLSKRFLLHYVFPALQKIDYKLPLISIARIARASFYAEVDRNTRNLLLHEVGHLLAADDLFKNASASIHINATFLYNRGEATYSFRTMDALTSAGERIGERHSHTVVSAAGVATTMSWNYASLIVAQLLPEDYVELKTYIRITAAFSIIADMIYSLSPYVRCRSGNDFCVLEENGIPPYAAMLSILLSSILLQCVLSGSSALIECLRKDKNEDLVDLPEISDTTSDTDEIELPQRYRLN